MKELFLDVKSGSPLIVDVPAPTCKKDGILVEVLYSLVSAGTERGLFDFGKKNLLEKAKERPDQVKKVIDKIKADSLLTAVKAAFNKLDEPMPLGYSCVGRVIEVGHNITEYAVGDLVACAGLSANHAEVVYIPKNLSVKLPKDFQDIRQAAFVALGAIAMQGIRQADVHFGDWVAVIGLGLVGQIVVRILKAAGCRVIGIDIDPSKKELADIYIDAFVKSDADNAVDEIMAITGQGCDGIIITAAASSNQPVEFAAEIARDRATISMVGVTRMDLPRRSFYQKELTFKLSRSYGPGRYDGNFEEKGIDYPIGYVKWTERRNMEEFIRLLHTKEISVSELITHEFDIADAQRAYELITDNPNHEKYIAVLIRYPERQEKFNKNVTIVKDFKKAEGNIGVGLIGGGNFARSVILPNMMKVKGYELIGLATTSGTTAGQTIKGFDFKYATTDYKELLSDPNIDLIIIATPHNSHAKFIVEALDAGKHVYVEKPLAINEEQLNDIKEAYERNHQHVFVGFNRRYSPFARFIKDSMYTDKYPCVIQYTVNAGMIPKDHWINDPEVGGGRIIGEVCHFVDFIFYLTGSVPVKVEATALNSSAENIINADNVSINMAFENGSAANIIYTSMGAKSYPKEKVTVFCNGQVGEINNFLSANIYGNKKKSLRKIEQDKGFVEEYEYIFNTLNDGSKDSAYFSNTCLVTSITYEIMKKVMVG